MQDIIQKSLPKLEKIRKEIHQFPEVSLNEYATAKRIEKYLKKYCKGEIIRIADTGVLLLFDTHKKGKNILLRADTDALPIIEINDFEYKSKAYGVSHKCGHDGHTAIMLGVAELLSKFPPESGKVMLLFQPAEEDGKGAEVVLKSEFFKKQEFDYVFALHNLPGFKKNKIVLRSNNFNANVKSMIIKLEGKTAHAAEPEKGHNPSLAIADILYFSEKLTYNYPEKDDFFLITPIHLSMGELAYGISAGSGEIHLTIRSWDLSLFDEKCKELEDFIDKSCSKYKLKREISWTQEFYANQNHSEAVELIRRSAIENNFEIQEMTYPFKWGEDFGLFTQKYKGAMFGLGAGESCPALHNPDYDFPDEITATGIQQFYQLIKEANKI
jgi:amidohydrolase